MSQAEGRWSDLSARIVSAVVMVVIGLVGLIAGGTLFRVLIAAVSGAMVWELMRMLAPRLPQLAVGAGVAAGALLLVAGYVLLPVYLLLAMAVAMGCAALTGPHRAVCGGFMVLLLLAGFEFLQLREQAGLAWMLWLILVVVASDVAGYFAGKAIGGRKFWPSISPKKTWSGTLAGWAGGALVGLAFMPILSAPALLVPFSVVVAFAGQMGDIAESAIKRRVGVKDSSALIPGHGGLLDRFDGMLGAAAFVMVAGPLIGLP